MMNAIRLLTLLVGLGFWFDSLLLELNESLVLSDQWIVIAFGLLISSVLFIVFRAYSFSLLSLNENDSLAFIVNYVLCPLVILTFPALLSLIGNNAFLEHEMSWEYSYWSKLSMFVLLYILLIDRKKSLQRYLFNIQAIDEMLRRDIFFVKFPPDRRSDLFGYDLVILTITIVSLYLMGVAIG